jgi:hypothetical protein
MAAVAPSSSRRTARGEFHSPRSGGISFDRVDAYGLNPLQHYAFEMLQAQSSGDLGYGRMSPMFGLEVIVALVSVVIVGTVLGRRYRVGPPVLLIFLGTLLGLIPAFAHIHVDGEIVLLLFLPAILYWEGLDTSLREVRANMRAIIFLSVILVILTAVAVSWAARALGMEPHAAAVLGAVLSPTDAAAVAGLAKKLPRRALAVLHAESLINDGTALVLLAVTVEVAIGVPRSARRIWCSDSWGPPARKVTGMSRPIAPDGTINVSNPSALALVPVSRHKPNTDTNSALASRINSSPRDLSLLRYPPATEKPCPPAQSPGRAKREAAL